MSIYTFGRQLRPSDVESALGLSAGSVVFSTEGTLLHIETPTLTPTQEDSLNSMMGASSFTGASQPPTGAHRVVNLYVNTAGKLVVEYEDTPEP